MPVTAGSSGSIWDCAIKTFAEVPGKNICGVCILDCTVSVSFSESRFVSFVPGGKIVVQGGTVRLVSDVFKITIICCVPSVRVKANSPGPLALHHKFDCAPVWNAG